MFEKSSRLLALLPLLCSAVASAANTKVYSDLATLTQDDEMYIIAPTGTEDTTTPKYGSFALHQHADGGPMTFGVFAFSGSLRAGDEVTMLANGSRGQSGAGIAAGLFFATKVNVNCYWGGAMTQAQLEFKTEYPTVSLAQHLPYNAAGGGSSPLYYYVYSLGGGAPTSTTSSSWNLTNLTRTGSAETYITTNNVTYTSNAVYNFGSGAFDAYVMLKNTSTNTTAADVNEVAKIHCAGGTSPSTYAAEITEYDIY